MTKTDLIAHVAEKTGITKVAAGAAVNAVFDRITEELKSGGSLVVPGFGKFSVRENKPKEGRNPKTGEVIQIAASRSGKFTAGKDLKGI